MDLSPAQKIAVQYVGSPTIVSAGAGSGKTRVLTVKIKHLVDNLGYDPSRILAITFTNKAAKEMQERLCELTGLKTRDFPWVRTFHSACLMILREHCERMGYKKPLNICAEYQREKLIKAILLEKNFNAKKYLNPLAAAISRAKNSGSPEHYLAEVNVRGLHRTTKAALFEAYSNRLRAANAVDFDDILLVTRDLLRYHTTVQQYYRDYFQYVLVDEYQDTNNLQEELTDLLVRNGNLFVVGDDYQSIYGFRGANIDNFLYFARRHSNARVFLLEQNHRSAREIVEKAEALIGHNQQMQKKCYSCKEGGLVDTKMARNEFDEAEQVIAKILQHKRAGLPFERMSILYRSNVLSMPFEQALRANGIPYRLKGDRGFFDRKEILDINCYLQAALHPYDDVAFDRIINVPKRGIGPGTVKKILQVKQEGMSLQDACREAIQQKTLSPRLATPLNKLIGFLASIRDDKPQAAIERILDEAGYRNHLKEFCKGEKTREYLSRMDNISFLTYIASTKTSLEEYLSDITLDSGDRNDSEDDPKKQGVVLSTVHGAKGLEWQVVFVVGLEQGLFPHYRAMDEDPVNGIQEERRLAYVACTRATQYLHLSCASSRKNDLQSPSQFFREAGLEVG